MMHTFVSYFYFFIETHTHTHTHTHIYIYIYIKHIFEIYYIFEVSGFVAIVKQTHNYYLDGNTRSSLLTSSCS